MYYPAMSPNVLRFSMPQSICGRKAQSTLAGCCSGTLRLPTGLKVSDAVHHIHHIHHSLMATNGHNVAEGLIISDQTVARNSSVGMWCFRVFWCSGTVVGVPGCGGVEATGAFGRHLSELHVYMTFGRCRTTSFV
jgi:hypothetical protein